MKDVEIIKARNVLSSRARTNLAKRLRVAAYCRVSTDSEDVQRSAFRHDVLIAVAVLFTLIVFLYLCHISRGFQVLIPGYGTIYSIISCHWRIPFFEICRQRRAGERHFFKV